ncbi:hypothetical protein RRG08_037784 [Elysia crispata]|uniref:Uncharacterized protein n=1 Tax=Elysia crispata TaxID=231223 RepID=A0AAE1BDD1_9GAST|nr:hypothetical protein RRG08_037784 [Elysia crispata]
MNNGTGWQAELIPVEKEQIIVHFLPWSCGYRILSEDSLSHVAHTSTLEFCLGTVQDLSSRSLKSNQRLLAKSCVLCEHELVRRNHIQPFDPTAAADGSPTFGGVPAVKLKLRHRLVGAQPRNYSPS